MMNRRGFFKHSGQTIIAGGLLVMSGYLLFREKPEEPCNLDFACENCHKLKNCNLPESKNKQSQK